MSGVKTFDDPTLLSSLFYASKAVCCRSSSYNSNASLCNLKDPSTTPMRL